MSSVSLSTTSSKRASGLRCSMRLAYFFQRGCLPYTCAQAALSRHVEACMPSDPIHDTYIAAQPTGLGSRERYSDCETDMGRLHMFIQLILLLWRRRRHTFRELTETWQAAP